MTNTITKPTKDYVKMNKALDKKSVESEINNIKSLQESGLFPMFYDFPLTLQFELTSHCNVKCKHCYNNSGEDNKALDPMTPQKWKNFAKYVVSKGGIFQCVISGGEPLLLSDDVFEIMDILHDDGTEFLVITNSLLLTQEKVEKFKKYRYKWFQISIDGATSEVHDEFRQRKGSFQRAVDGAYMITKAGIPLTIAHSITPDSLSQVHDMCKLAYQLGASSIIVGEITPSGRCADNHDLLLSKDEKNWLYEQINELSRIYSGKMSIQRSSGTVNQLTRYMNIPNAGGIIRPNGDIRLDCMAPFIIGNVLEDDFYKLWDEKSKTCWSNPKVVEYVNGFNEDSDINNLYTNYSGDDILLN